MRFIIFIFIIISLSQYANAQGQLYFDNTYIAQIDTVFPLEYEKNITLYNRGNSHLVISSLAASCGCTSFLLSKDTIPPLDSAVLFVKIDLHTVYGNRQYNIYFNSSDTSQHRSKLDINLFVYRDLISEPKHLPSYSNVEPSSFLNYKITLINTSEKDIEIRTPFSADNTKFEVVSILPTDKVIRANSHQEYEIKIRLKSSKFIYSKLYIPTNSISVPKVEYSLMINTK